MNKLTEELESDFIPRMALIIYSSKTSENHVEKYYIESRKITSKGKMCAGKPLHEATLAKIVKTLSLTDKSINPRIHGEIPNNLLYCDYGIDNKVLVWYRKPEERMLFFSESAEIPNGKMIVPGMVYAVNNRRLSVFAYKGKTPKVLYRAPFYNVGEGGVCLGSATLPEPTDITYENIMEYWEKMFWLSEFVHILGKNPIKGNLSTITKECIKNNSRFPEDVLIKSEITLKSLYK